jgi:nucleolar protein 9
VRAIIERASVLHSQELEVVEFICSAFELDTEDDKLLLVPCALRLASLTVSQCSVVGELV